MCSNPILFLGQASVQIGTEMSRLGRQERMCIPSSIFMDSRPLIGDDAKHISVLQLSMPHLFAFPSDNSASVELIMDKLFRSLEASDNATGIGVVSDFCSGLGSSLSSALVSEIKDCLPHLQLTCAMALPPESTIHGIGALNGLMGVQTALQYADAVMLRSLDDAMAMVEEAASASVPSTLQQANMLIACDLYCALGPKSVCSNSDYEELMHDNSVFSTQQTELDWESVAGLYCWPANVCSTTNKLCDVRTSLWRLHLRNQHLASKTKGAHISAASLAKTENYNPLRALAANMHTLHVTAGERPVLHSELLLHKSISSVVKAASLGCFTFEDTLQMPGSAVRRLHLAPGTDSFSPSELATLLHWACPETIFPSNLGRHSCRDIVSGQTIKQRHIAGRTNLNATGKTEPIESNFLKNHSTTSIMRSGDTGNRMSTHQNRADSSQLAALAFTSPYAQQTLAGVFEKGHMLFTRNAYLTRYSEVGVEYEDFGHCFTYLSEVLSDWE